MREERAQCFGNRQTYRHCSTYDLVGALDVEVDWHSNEVLVVVKLVLHDFFLVNLEILIDLACKIMNDYFLEGASTFYPLQFGSSYSLRCPIGCKDRCRSRLNIAYCF